MMRDSYYQWCVLYCLDGGIMKSNISLINIRAYNPGCHLRASPFLDFVHDWDRILCSFEYILHSLFYDFARVLLIKWLLFMLSFLICIVLELLDLIVRVNSWNYLLSCLIMRFHDIWGVFVELFRTFGAKGSWIDASASIFEVNSESLMMLGWVLAVVLKGIFIYVRFLW